MRVFLSIAAPLLACLLLLVVGSDSYWLAAGLARRDFARKFGGVAAATATFTLILPGIAGAGETRGGVDLTPMNSLTFNYRGGGNAGAPKPLDEE